MRAAPDLRWAFEVPLRLKVGPAPSEKSPATPGKSPATKVPGGASGANGSTGWLRWLHPVLAPAEKSPAHARKEPGHKGTGRSQRSQRQYRELRPGPEEKKRP